MIRRVSYEFNQASEKEKKVNSFENIIKILKNGYVELLGEAKPLPVEEMYYAPLDYKMSLKEEGKTKELKIPVVYEYKWSVGITGENRNWFDKLDENDSVVVQLIFHTKSSRFSVREVAVDLKQMPPFMKEDGKIADFIEKAKSAIGTTGKVMELTGFSVPGKIISALSEMKMNSVKTEEFPWYVKPFSFEQESGVEWHIPRSYFQKAGNRLVGTLAAYFIDCDVGNASLSIEIRVFMKSKDYGELFVCPILQKDNKELFVEPYLKTEKKQK
jgi:hypothetical protein